jgi:hypothetical protein
MYGIEFVFWDLSTRFSIRNCSCRSLLLGGKVNAGLYTSFTAEPLVLSSPDTCHMESGAFALTSALPSELHKVIRPVWPKEHKDPSLYRQVQQT